MHKNRAVDHLAEALTYKTLSHNDWASFELEYFKGFLDFLERTYPLCHSKLNKTMINDYAPIFHWQTESSEKPVLMIAHYDVVPANDEGWQHPPFGGIVEDNKIWGRGAIDDKNSVIGIMETIEGLLEADFKPKRDLYIAFGIDEEKSSQHGAGKIARHFLENGLTFECILDEGGIVTEGDMLGIEGDVAVIGIAEKGQCSFEFTFKGDEGHSSAPPDRTSLGVMASFIKNVESHPRKARLTSPVADMLKLTATRLSGVNKLVMSHPETFFEVIKRVMKKGKQTRAMLKTTAVFTMADAGSAPNVLPSEAKLVGNFRILQGETIEDIKTWLRSFDPDVEIRLIGGDEPSGISDMNTKSFKILKSCINKVFGNVLISPYLMIGGTDSIQYDKLSKNIYRFMPCRLSSDDLDLMHAANEHITIQNLHKMIEFYTTFIEEIS